MTDYMPLMFAGAVVLIFGAAAIWLVRRIDRVPEDDVWGDLTGYGRDPKGRF